MVKRMRRVDLLEALPRRLGLAFEERVTDLAELQVPAVQA